MAKIHSIKRRMKSVQSIRQITSAMEMVAASKLSRAQGVTAASRLYVFSAREALSYIKTVVPGGHPFFVQNTNPAALYIVFTSDRGLAGAYTANVMKKMLASTTHEPNAKIIIIGKRGAQLLARQKHAFEIVGLYPAWQHPTVLDISPISQTAMRLFTAGEIGRVVLVYTDFHSISRQETVSRVVLPVPDFDTTNAGILRSEGVSLEPSASKLLEYIVPRFIDAQIYQASMEASTSEHASRMMAMNSASENANDIIDSLTLEYNSARQAGVTNELAEIAAGSQAIL